MPSSRRQGYPKNVFPGSVPDGVHLNQQKMAPILLYDTR